MTWSKNDRVKDLVEKSYPNLSDAELIYIRHTKVPHSEDHIAVTILLEQRRQAADAARAVG